MRLIVGIVLAAALMQTGIAGNKVEAYDDMNVNRNANKEAAKKMVSSGAKQPLPGGIKERVTVTFLRPKSHPFREFTDDEKKDVNTTIYDPAPNWVDIIADSHTLPEKLNELNPGPASISVKGDFKKPTNASQFPLFCEGNLKTKRGGGGTGADPDKPKKYWASDVKIAGVDIDVDWNRNGKIENNEDDAQEGEPVKYLADQGALVLVNCDKDNSEEGTQRDFNNYKIENNDDLADMSPLSLELKRDLKHGETLWLVISTVGESKVWGRVMDKNLMGADDDTSVVNESTTELRIDNCNSGVDKYFPGGKKKRYDGRFFVEGLRFAKELEITLEIRENGKATESDSIRILNTPWLANNNVQKLAAVTPGNLINSRSYLFKTGHGAKKTNQGAGFEFVQDSCEWGFQLRRRKDSATKGRAMITALRLKTVEEDQHPEKFLSSTVAVYGYEPEPRGLDEVYFTAGDGDSGGNLECLPPDKDDKHSFGRLIYGDTMSKKLRGFLDRQKAQVKGGAAVISISKLNLSHIDEFVCVMPTSKRKPYFVLMPDWGKAFTLITGSRTWKHGVVGVNPLGANAELDTYSKLYNFLKYDIEGKKLNAERLAIFKALQAEVKAVVPVANIKYLPGMFFNNTVTGGAVQRSFPRNIANSQPPSKKKLIVSEPHDESREVGGKVEMQPSRFFVKWKKTIAQVGVAAEGEDMFFAWRKRGEAHCASNTVREPFTK